MNQNRDNHLLDGHYTNSPTHLPTPPRKQYDGLASLLIIVGFIIVIGINFFKSLSNSSLQRDAVLGRQVELLNQLKSTDDAPQVQRLISEYDSLSVILENIPE